MCLLVAFFHSDPAGPLVIAANRDEYYSRPATTMTTLHDPGAKLRILGGRDLRAGGTWLAVNEAGVVAGLTNRPMPDGPNRAKRSRGELPLALAAHATATEAVDAFVARVRPDDYNPAWLLVGDRTDLYYVDVTADHSVVVERLPPGTHVLENRSLHEPSPKADRVRALLGAASGAGDQQRGDAVTRLLADHHQPADEPDPDATSQIAREARAICVHDPTDDYGTRSSTFITITNDASALPRVIYADGAPCRTPWCSADDQW